MPPRPHCPSPCGTADAQGGDGAGVQRNTADAAADHSGHGGEHDDKAKRRARAVTINTDELSDDEEYDKQKAQAAEPPPVVKKKKKEWIVGHETKDGRFLIAKYMRETALYLVFLVAFTYTQLIGRNSDLINAYSRMWRQTLVHSVSNVTDRSSAMLFFNNTIANDFFEFDYFEEKYYSPAGKMGSPYGSALIGSAKLRQLRVKATDCHSLHNKLTSQGTLKSQGPGPLAPP
eukprot:Tamp_02921.p2 GENE.Tamp_02921~~Tamp_02921.p2  ORF type:complete len:266 (+),score=45.26 Tamp_02921:104-799(+)